MRVMLFLMFFAIFSLLMSISCHLRDIREATLAIATQQAQPR